MAVMVACMAFMGACSDDDEPKQKSTSLATMYIQPTAIHIPDLSNTAPNERPYIRAAMSFTGEEITFASAPQQFAELNRFFCDTTCPVQARRHWSETRSIFLVKPLIGLKAIAADDSWGKRFPKGSDVSYLFYVDFSSADAYIKDGFKDNELAKESFERMSLWKPEWGYSLNNKIMLDFSFIRSGMVGDDETLHEDKNCQGHRYTIIATFPDGTTLTSENNIIWCSPTA